MRFTVPWRKKAAPAVAATDATKKEKRKNYAVIIRHNGEIVKEEMKKCAD